MVKRVTATLNVLFYSGFPDNNFKFSLLQGLAIKDEDDIAADLNNHASSIKFICNRLETNISICLLSIAGNFTP